MRIQNIVHLANASRHGPEAFDPTTKDARDLIASLVVDGWDPAHPMRVYALDGSEKVVLAVRPEYPNKFECLGNVVTLEDIQGQAASQKGDATFAGNSGARRAYFLPVVNAVRVAKGMSVLHNIPTTKVVYGSELERDVDNIRHNNLASLGKSEADWHGQLDVGFKLFQAGAGETAIKQKLASTKHVSQKIHALCVANSTWPDLRVVEGVLDETYPWGEIVPGELRKLTATTKKAKTEKTPPVSEEKALEYLTSPKSETNSGTPVSKTTVKALIGNTKLSCFKLCLELAAAMDAEKLASYDQLATYANRCWNGLVTPNSKFGERLIKLCDEQEAEMAAQVAAAKAKAKAKETVEAVS